MYFPALEQMQSWAGKQMLLSSQNAITFVDQPAKGLVYITGNVYRDAKLRMQIFTLLSIASRIESGIATCQLSSLAYFNFYSWLIAYWRHFENMDEDKALQLNQDQ